MSLQNLVSHLRSAGYRVTTPRQRILATIVGQEGHFTADSLHMALVAQERAVDLSTIYRTLELLTELALILPLRGTMPAEYERAHHHAHHHLICESCGTTTELPHTHLEALGAHLLEHHHFEARIAHLAIPGTCKNCMLPKAESE